MSKNQIIIALVVLCLVGTIWGSVQNKKSTSLERQLVAMRQQEAPAAPVMDEAAASEAQAAVEVAQAEAADLKSQNKELLADVATLKGSVAGLKKEMEEADGDSKALEAMQAQLAEGSAAIKKLEETLLGAKGELDQKHAALTAAEKSVAGFDDVKTVLANTVDAYSAKNQALTAEVEQAAQNIRSLENAIEARTKLLIANGEELGRTKLNMNVLLSKIAAQNKSLAILEETRVALEKELAFRFQIIEELQQQLSAKVIVEAVVVEESPVEEAPAH